MRIFRSAPLALGSIAAVTILAGFVISYQLPDDEAEIAETIEAFALGDDPALCSTAVTQRYLEQSTGLPGAAARSDCELSADYESVRAESVSVSEIEVDGDTATADITYEGTPLDGSTIEVSLVDDAGDWKLDRRLGFVTLDRSGMESGLRELYSGEPYHYPPKAVACNTESILRMSDGRLERLLISRDASEFVAVAIECNRESFERSIRSELRRAEYPPSLVHCVAAEVARRSDAELAELALDPVAYARIGVDCDRGATLSAYSESLASEDYAPQVIDCVIAGLGELSDRELARTSVDISELDRIFDDCEAENG